MDVATHLESVDAELEAFISRRADKNPDPAETEESWKASVRRFHARNEQQLRWEWVRYFEHMARCHARLAEEHERKAQKLLQEGSAA